MNRDARLVVAALALLILTTILFIVLIGDVVITAISGGAQ